MRFATPLTRILAALILAVLTLARPASAQPDVYYDGLLHHPLGSATLTPLSTFPPQLLLEDIGSSGNDGVAIDLPPSARGYSLQWNTLVDLGAGSSHTLDLRGVSGGVGAVVSAGSVRSDRVSLESVDLTPDFSGVGATNCWIVLTDASGAVVKRSYRPLPLTVHLSSLTPGVEIHEKSISATSLSVSNLIVSIGIAFDAQVRANLGGGGPGVECSAVTFICDSGDPISELRSVQLTGAVFSGAGSLLIEQLGIVPPCAGCPNGPEDTGDIVARGDARYGMGGGGGGGAGGELALENLGSSGNDGVRILGEETCCRVDELGVSISDALQTDPLVPGSVTFETFGTLGGLPDQSLGHLSCTFDGDEWSYVPDFSAVGATGYRAVLYLFGGQVADVPNPADGVRKWGDGHVTLMKITEDSEEYRIVCITHPCPGSNVSVGGVDYLVDEVRLIPIDPMPGSPILKPDNLSAMEMRTTATTTLTIVGTNFRSSAPVVSVEPRSAPVDLAARLSPNPASGPVSVVFALPRAEHARVSVIDIAGRQVRGLADRDFAAGAHRLLWDGRDDAGHATPAGVYFVRVESGASQRVTRVSRLW